jgi:tRNA(Ile)-lysidine synthase
VHKLAQSALRYIRKNDLIRAGDRVGIAVSGGADSVGLLRLILELKDELGVVLSVVHLNHNLRGLESDADEQFVRELAHTHGLQIACGSCDVKSYSRAKQLSLEAAARELRCEFFRQILQSQADQIATAHTLDDQAETVLLKLARGAGTRGLAGIYPRVTVNHQPSAVSYSGIGETVSLAKMGSIVRPLLGTRRSQLREYLAKIGQSWREDATNQDLQHTRNRIRHEVLPQLEHELNPAICQVLAQTAEIARAEEASWAAEVSRLLGQVWESDGRHSCLKTSVLASFPLAVQRRVVRAAAESLGLSLEFCHVEEILNLHIAKSSALPGNWIVTRHRGRLNFQQSPELVGDYEYELPVPGKITVREAGINLEVVEVTVTSEPAAYLLDSSFARGLVVRNWRMGERFWPSHSKEPKKIKELLQDRHITGPEKARWPVVASGGEVLWMRGFGVRRDIQGHSATGILIRELQPLQSNLPD